MVICWRLMLTYLTRICILQLNRFLTHHILPGNLWQLLWRILWFLPSCILWLLLWSSLWFPRWLSLGLYILWICISYKKWYSSFTKKIKGCSNNRTDTVCNKIMNQHYTSYQFTKKTYQSSFKFPMSIAPSDDLPDHVRYQFVLI